MSPSLIGRMTSASSRRPHAARLASAANLHSMTSRSHVAASECRPGLKCDEITPKAERERARVSRRLEPAHHPLTYAGRSGRILRSIVESTTPPVLDSGSDFGFRRAVVLPLKWGLLIISMPPFPVPAVSTRPPAKSVDAVGERARDRRSCREVCLGAWEVL